MIQKEYVLSNEFFTNIIIIIIIIIIKIEVYLLSESTARWSITETPRTTYNTHVIIIIIIIIIHLHD